MDITAILKTLLIAMMPIGELRVSIPVAITQFNMNPFLAFFVSVVGNMIPVVIFIYLLEPISNFLMKHSKFFRWFFEKLFHYTRKKHSKKFEQLESLALITFVAIPLPMTGGWSGALAAFVFGFKHKTGLRDVFLGVTIAGVIVTFLTVGIESVIRWF
jgi:uncharacterized membrane protein